MADIALSRPAAQTRQTVPSAAENRFVFDFPTDDATLSRDGDNLVLTFDDGGSLELTDFYTTYSKENIPDFVVDGAEISGADFFAAMNEPDLMPAAGPATGTTVANGARYHEYANASLAEGIDRLGGLDLGMNFPSVEEEDREAYGWKGDDAGRGADSAGSAPSTPLDPTPDIETPVPPRPKPDPDHPGNGESDSNWVPASGNAHIVVDEGALSGGSDGHTLHGFKGQYSFTVDVHGEPGGSIVLTYGDATVTLQLPEDDATRISPDGNRTVTVNGVKVTITDAELVDGKWQVNYTYELTGNQTHDKNNDPALDHDTTLTGSIDITVTDGSGDTASGKLNVEVHDDVPRFSTESTGNATELGGTFGLEYGADGAATTGALTAEGATQTTTDGNETKFTFAEGVLTVTKGEDGKYSYSFDPADPNVTVSKEITLTATDSDNDTASITITVGKTVPVITPGTDPDPDPDRPDNPDDPTTTQVEVGKIVVDEGDQPQHGETETHAKTGTGSFRVDLHGEDGTITIGGMTITIKGGEVVSVEGDASAHGVQLTVQPENVTFVDGKWEVNYTYELTGNQTHDQGTGNDTTLTGSIGITVTDGSGDTAEGVLKVEVHDDVPTITTSDYRSHQMADPTPQISLDFRQDDFTNLNPGSNGNGTGYSRIEQNSVQIFASNVKYTYADDGRLVVEQVDDRNGEDLDGSFRGKELSISQDGLGVGNWDNNEITMKPGDNPGSTLAEALVLETKNGSVSYGMNLEFGKFEDGDKALITFMLTPRNNNDDTVVFTKEVSWADLANGKIHIDVPDGFTKVFISALPGENGNNSAFTVKTLEMTRPSWEHEGAFAINPGADGIASDSFHWDVDLSNFGIPPMVEVKGAPGSGLYELELVKDPGDPNVMFFTLSGKPNGDNGTNLDGNALFIVRVDPATGKWTIDQFYNFDLENGNKPTFDLKFQVTDSDGDVASASQTVNADLDILLDRFQNVVDDTFDGKDAKDDTNGAILTGTEVNDLMYGRGGNDILFGDAGNDFETHLRNELAPWGTPAADYEQIFWRLNGSKPNADQPNGLDLEAILKKLEKYEGEGGDDALFGGLGNDILFGGAGNDYLYGNGKNKHGSDSTDRDMLFGGSGNDILVYDGNDVIIHGGSDIDILLAGKGDPSLAAMLDAGNGSGDRPYVGGIEILLRSMGTDHVENLGITSHKTLEERYGIKIENEMLVLSAAWKQIDSVGGNLTFEFTLEDGSKLQLETTLGQSEVKGDYTPLVSADAAARTTADTADDAVAAIPDVNPAAQQNGGDDSIADNAALDVLAADAPVVPDPTMEAVDRAPDQTMADADHSPAMKTAAVDRAVAARENDDARKEGTDDNEDLFGTDGEDMLFGMSGDDYLDGGASSDSIYGGAGDDLIVYDPTDYLIHGGEGIDVLLADTDRSLQDMLQATDPNSPRVESVEVLIKGAEALDLTNMDQLAETLGMTIDHDKGTLTLTGWTREDSVTGEDGKTYTTYTKGDVTLETTLTAQQDQASEAESMAQQFTLQTING